MKLEVAWSHITSNKEVGDFGVRQKIFTIYSLFGSPCRAPAVLRTPCMSSLLISPLQLMQNENDKLLFFSASRQIELVGV